MAVRSVGNYAESSVARALGLARTRRFAAYASARRSNAADAERYRSLAAAGCLGMSVETSLPVYGHRHPKDAVTKLTAKPTASASPQKRDEKKETNVVKIQ